FLQSPPHGPYNSRRTRRRARERGIQPRSRRAPRRSRQGISGQPGHLARPHFHHFLRERAAAVHRANRRMLAEESPRALENGTGEQVDRRLIWWRLDAVAYSAGPRAAATHGG